METTRNTAKAVALLVLVLGLLAAAGSALVASSAAGPVHLTDGRTGPYGWPVEPFDRQHPVRGNFGDPRTVFDGPRSQRTIDTGAGMFQFHHGVDISAPDGTPVYPVADGIVTRTHGDRVTVDCGNGRSFQYWHLTVSARLRVGQRAITGKTVLGRILPKREHVHLTHLENGQPVNPLMPGRLTPYRDPTRPSILGITFRRSDLGRAIAPTHVTGRVAMYVEATDTPALPVPGRWNGFPVTPAKISWRIETAAGRTVVASSIAWDVRRTIPGTSSFWVEYARGSHQNWPVFSDGKARGMTGRYIFRLSTLDAGRLAAGRYRLIVSVTDTDGNRSVARVELVVHGET